MTFGPNICFQHLFFEQYGEDFKKTDGKPMFLTMGHFATTFVKNKS